MVPEFSGGWRKIPEHSCCNLTYQIQSRNADLRVLNSGWSSVYPVNLLHPALHSWSPHGLLHLTWHQWIRTHSGPFIRSCSWTWTWTWTSTQLLHFDSHFISVTMLFYMFCLIYILYCTSVSWILILKWSTNSKIRLPRGLFSSNSSTSFRMQQLQMASINHYSG
jgi:hypothetical protein